MIFEAVSGGEKRRRCKSVRFHDEDKNADCGMQSRYMLDCQRRTSVPR